VPPLFALSFRASAANKVRLRRDEESLFVCGFRLACDYVETVPMLRARSMGPLRLLGTIMPHRRRWSAPLVFACAFAWRCHPEPRRAPARLVSSDLSSICSIFAALTRQYVSIETPCKCLKTIRVGTRHPSLSNVGAALRFSFDERANFSGATRSGHPGCAIVGRNARSEVEGSLFVCKFRSACDDVETVPMLRGFCEAWVLCVYLAPSSRTAAAGQRRWFLLVLLLGVVILSERRSRLVESRPASRRISLRVQNPPRLQPYCLPQRSRFEPFAAFVPILLILPCPSIQAKSFACPSVQKYRDRHFSVLAQIFSHATLPERCNKKMDTPQNDQKIPQKTDEKGLLEPKSKYVMQVYPPGLTPEEKSAYKTIARVTAQMGQPMERIKPRRAEPKPKRRSRKRARAARAGESSNLTAHESRCSVCRHEDRAGIEEEFLHWHSPRLTAYDYGVTERAIYRHAHAFNLFAARDRNLRFALGRVIDRVDRIPVMTPDSIIRAVHAFAHINNDGQWIEPPSHLIVSSGSRPAAPAQPLQPLQPQLESGSAPAGAAPPEEPVPESAPPPVKITFAQPPRSALNPAKFASPLF
jgi:hypothetical protein